MSCCMMHRMARSCQKLLTSFQARYGLGCRVQVTSSRASSTTFASWKTVVLNTGRAVPAIGFGTYGGLW